jgi:hypothetical protein
MKRLWDSLDDRPKKFLRVFGICYGVAMACVGLCYLVGPKALLFIVPAVVAAILAALVMELLWVSK